MAQGRLIPNDYATIRPSFTVDKAKAHWSAGEDTIRRWDREIGYSGAHRIFHWKPEEDETLRLLLADNRTWKEVAEALPGRNRDGCRERATKFGWKLSPEGYSRARRASQEYRKPAPKAKAVRNRSKSVGDNFSKIVTDSPAQEAARKLQRLGPVYPMRVVNPRLTDWNVYGQRMSEAAMFAKLDDYRQRGKL